MLKTLVIGLDGATWDILDPMMQAGSMPNLKGLVERGTRSKLRSTLPAITGPAWACMLTGKNAGKTTAADWGLLTSDYRLEFTHAGSIKAAPFWHYLGMAEERTGVVAVPTTYPPRELEGFMLTGMGSPGRQYEHTWPPELRKVLDEKYPDYKLDIPTNIYTPDSALGFLGALTAHASQLSSITELLVKQEGCDHLFVVYTATDRVQHCMIDEVMNVVAGGDVRPDLAQVLRAFYGAIDDQIGRLLALASADTHVVVLSDHGFTRARKILSLNDWLEQEGFLGTYSTRHVGNRFMRAIAILADKFARWRAAGVRTLSTQRMLGKPVNWKRTRAFCNSSNGIYLNRKGRFDSGVVSQPEGQALRRELRERLLNVADPDTGQRIVESVLDCEEVYVGPYADLLPDLLLLFHDDAYIGSRYFNTDAPPPDNLFSLPTERTLGQHHRHGIFVGAGPMFEKQSDGGTIHLQDIAPLLLYLNQIPIPEDMDGRVPLDFLTPEAQAVGARAQIAAPDDSIREDSLTDEEQAILHRRLIDLGYLE